MEFSLIVLIKETYPIAHYYLEGVRKELLQEIGEFDWLRKHVYHR